MSRVSLPPEERFWPKVDRGAADACWPWLANIDCHGYGRFKLGTNQRAHRVAYELAVGPIPHGLTIDHLCERKDCVNPAHLEAVSEPENRARWLTAERVEESRMRAKTISAGMTARDHALRSGTCRLSDEQVREIRRRRAGGETLRSIAEDMPVNHAQVGKIGRRESYAWIE